MSITVFFPNVNPIVFNKYESPSLTYIEDNLQKNSYCQKYSPNDKITFQVGIRRDELVYGIKYKIILNLVKKDSSEIINLLTESYDQVNNLDYFIFNKRISEFTNYFTTPFYLELQSYTYILNDIGIEQKEYDLGTYISNDIKLITGSEINNTKLIKYSNTEDKFDALFSEMVSDFEIRLPAYFLRSTYGSDNDIFIGSNHDIEQISSTPFVEEILYIGKDGIGIPAWHRDNIISILCCDIKKIDNISYSLTENTDFSSKIEDGYAYEWLNINLCKSRNKFSDAFEINTGDWIDFVPNIINFDENGGQITVRVSSSGNFYISNDNNFLNISPMFGSNGNNYINITSDPNNTTNDRNVYIKAILESDENILAQLNITQPFIKLLDININNLTLNKQNLYTSQAQITSNIEWEFINIPESIEVSQISGTGNANINISVKNGEYFGRENLIENLVLIYKNDSSIKQEIYIEIESQGLLIFSQQENVQVNPAGHSIVFSGKTNIKGLKINVLSDIGIGNSIDPSSYTVQMEGSSNIYNFVNGQEIPFDPGKNELYNYTFLINFPANQSLTTDLTYGVFIHSANLNEVIEHIIYCTQYANRFLYFDKNIYKILANQTSVIAKLTSSEPWSYYSGYSAISPMSGDPGTTNITIIQPETSDDIIYNGREDSDPQYLLITSNDRTLGLEATSDIIFEGIGNYLEIYNDTFNINYLGDAPIESTAIIGNLNVTGIDFINNSPNNINIDTISQIGIDSNNTWSVINGNAIPGDPGAKHMLSSNSFFNVNPLNAGIFVEQEYSIIIKDILNNISKPITIIQRPYPHIQGNNIVNILQNGDQSNGDVIIASNYPLIIGNSYPEQYPITRQWDDNDTSKGNYYVGLIPIEPPIVEPPEILPHYLKYFYKLDIASDANNGIERNVQLDIFAFENVDNFKTNIKFTVDIIQEEYISQNKYLLDAPFNGDTLDYSGNNNNLTVINGVPTFDHVTGSMLRNSEYPAVRFDAVSLNSFINNCEIQIEFSFNSKTSPAYPNIIDSSNSGSPGILAQRNGNILQIGFISSSNDIVNIPMDIFTVGKFYRLIMLKNFSQEAYMILDTDNEETIFYQLFNDRNPNITSTRDFIDIGHSVGFGGRWLNGYVRNLKIELLNL